MCDIRPTESTQAEMKKDEPSFVERLLGNVLRNFEVNITNIHIRYEDATTIPDTFFAAGITLKEIAVHVRFTCARSNRRSVPDQ